MRIGVGAVRVVSTLPARSTDAYRIVKTPSDASVTVAPVGDDASGNEPSTVYRVWATPDPASVERSVTVTGPRCQALPTAALSSTVWGAVASTSKSVGGAERTAPDPSTWLAVTDQCPSASVAEVDQTPVGSHSADPIGSGASAAVT